MRALFTILALFIIAEQAHAQTLRIGNPAGDYIRWGEDSTVWINGVAQPRSVDPLGVVMQVKSELLARGVNLAGPCGAFQITSRVGWRLRAEGWGLIASTGNGCDVNGQRYRADTLMKPDGSVVDLLQKAEDDNGDTSNPLNFNIPMWAPTGPQPPGNFRHPFDPGDAPVLPPMPTPGPILPMPGPVVLDDAPAIMLKIDLLKIYLSEMEQRLIQRIDEPGWFTKVFGSRYTQIILTGLATWFTTDFFMSGDK